MRCAKETDGATTSKMEIYLTAPYLCGRVMKYEEEMIFGKCELEERL